MALTIITIEYVPFFPSAVLFFIAEMLKIIAVLCMAVCIASWNNAVRLFSCVAFRSSENLKKRN